MKKEPYITMLSNRIHIIMHNSSLEDKYPGGIHVVHEQSGDSDVKFTFTHINDQITDAVTCKILTEEFYALVGESFE